jgi:predicted Zn-dependent protease
LGAGRAEEVFTELTGFVEEQPDYLPGTLLLAEAARATGRHRIALERYEAVLAHEPALLPALQGAFAAALAGGDHATAGSMIERIRLAAPDAALADFAAGELALARGEAAAAVAAFRAAHARAPSTGSALRLAEALRGNADIAAAQSLLFDWLATREGDTAARAALASLELEAGNLPEAQRQFDILNALVPDDPVVLNNLAWIYDKREDPRALEFAERALERAPDSVEAIDTLGWILVRKGDPARGLGLLERAHAARPDDPVIARHFAHALAASGDHTRARRILERALAEHPRFDERDAAEAMLARLAKRD